MAKTCVNCCLNSLDCTIVEISFGIFEPWRPNTIDHLQATSVNFGAGGTAGGNKNQEGIQSQGPRTKCKLGPDSMLKILLAC
jgi:hypothetical protein